MGLFEKRVKVYEAKGKKAEFKALKTALKEAGFKGLRFDVWTDEISGCGCGAKLDNRDFGANGKIDRDIYSIRVLEQDEERANELIKKMVPEYTPYIPRADRLRMI